MRRIVLLLVMLSAAIVSCSIEVQEAPACDTVRLTLNLEDCLSSKAGVPQVNEEDIRFLRVLEFNSKGDVLTNRTLVPESGMSVSVRKDQPLEIYFVANDSTTDLDDVSSKEDFLSRESSYADLSQETMVMLGHLSGTFARDSAVNVRLERLAAKIMLDTLVFKITKSAVHDYNGASHTLIYMEKTPRSCTYGIKSSDVYVDAYDSKIYAGVWSRRPSSALRYTEDDKLVWEYDDRWYVYAYPNTSADSEGRSVLAIEYRTLYNVGEYWSDGEYHIVTHQLNGILHIILPQIRPNTLYELQKIVIRGTRNRTVSLSSEEGTADDMDCEFVLRDMTTGEELGTETGEVWYEVYDN